MSKFKNILTTLIFTAGSVAFSQAQNLCLGNDTSVCIGNPVTIDLCGGGVGSPVVELPAPGSATLGDDDFTAALNIGFTFNFYGNNYTQCIAGDNGIVSFNVAQAGGYCSWVVTNLPTGTASAQNAILTPWQDLFMPAGGTIYYQTIGTAPNRRFVIFYDGLSMFSSSCQTPSQCFTGSVILHETTNIIETHLSNKTTCASWGSGTATHGVNSINSTNWTVVPGRNNSVWTAQNDSWAFTPTSATNYNVASIPFTIVTTPSSQGLVWGDSNGNSYPYNGGTLNVTAQAGPVGYFISAGTCGTGTGSVSDTSWVTGTTADVTASSTPDICTSGQGSVTATPTVGTSPYTYNWTTLGNNPNQTVNNVLAGTHTVEMTDALGCTATASVTVQDTPASFQGSTTEVSCPGGNDGTAFAEMIPPLGNITYQWDDPNAQTTQTATGLTAGTYNCTVTSDIGCSEVVTVTVTEIPGMVGVIVNQSDVTCNSGNDGSITVDVQQGTPPYSYVWDNSASTTNSANDLAVGPHQVTVTDANGCVITIDGVLNEPAALDITFLTPDTQICPEDEITLDVAGAGGSSPYTFTWSQGGNVIGTGMQITVDPDVTNTEYCVTLSEACGSPTDQECVMITFPTPIVPNAVPDMYEKCVPSPFEFENTSSNGAEIATAIWDFGFDDYYVLENGNDSTSLYFDDIGIYDLVMTVTSIYGCVYSDTVENIIRVKPRPTADFTFSNNPATIFETVVVMQDRSSSDVIQWEWDSPFSTPTSSNLTIPTFTFPDGEVGQYPVTLMVETELGCRDTVTYLMNVVEDVLFYAPNTFTPDGDEFNQTWQPVVSGIDEFNFELLIFNRWGEVIWESRDPNVGWDGTHNGRMVQDGTYAWIARVSVPYNDDKLEFSGSINLIR